MEGVSQIRAKSLVNAFLRPFGAALVSSKRGPRGYIAALRRIKAMGVSPQQIIDVGANKGLWTQECLSVFPEARYFLAEPLAENGPSLAQMSQRYDNVDHYMGALGAEPGRLTLYAHHDQSSFLSSEYAESGDCRVHEVEVRTLDSFLAQGRIRPPDFIKADVQGFELQVLKGAGRCLDTASLLLLEVSFQQVYQGSPLAHEVISFVGGLGFAIYDVCTYSQRPLDGELAQSDILFARVDSVLFGKRGWARTKLGS